MLNSSNYHTMKFALMKHGDDFWQEPREGEGDHNIYLLEDVEAALAKEGYELVLKKKE